MIGRGEAPLLLKQAVLHLLVNDCWRIDFFDWVLMLLTVPKLAQILLRFSYHIKHGRGRLLVLLLNDADICNCILVRRWRLLVFALVVEQ